MPCQSGRQWPPSGSLPSGMDAAKIDDHRAASSGCVVDRKRAAHRDDESLAEGEPEPDAVALRLIAEPLERLEHQGER